MTSLFEQLVEHENFCLAFHKASKGKQERFEVIRFRENVQKNLKNQRRAVVSNSLQLGQYRYFEVFEPKRRLICAAPFTDRVLHHAVMNVCEPEFERYAIFDSYACRHDKGMHAAIHRAQYFSRRYPWFLKLDIKKYFDTIDQTNLLQLLAKRLKDNDLLALFHQIIVSYHTTPGKGMPIGNLISQHCANLYLGVFDHWIKDEKGVKGYVRYMDDFIVFAQDKGVLLKFRLEIRDFLESHLQLELHAKQVLNQTRCGIPFLGMRVLPHRILLSRSARQRFTKKFKSFEKRYADGTWSIEELSNHVNPLIGFTKIANCKGLRNKVVQQYGIIT